MQAAMCIIKESSYKKKNIPLLLQTCAIFFIRPVPILRVSTLSIHLLKTRHEYKRHHHETSPLSLLFKYCALHHWLSWWKDSPSDLGLPACQCLPEYIPWHWVTCSSQVDEHQEDWCLPCDHQVMNTSVTIRLIRIMPATPILETKLGLWKSCGVATTFPALHTIAH